MQQTFAEVLDDALRGSPDSTRRMAQLTGEDGYFIGYSTLSQWRSGTATPYLNEHTLHRLLNLERRVPTEPGRLVRALLRTATRDAEPEWRWTPPPLPGRAGPEVLKAELALEGITNRCRSTLVAGSDEYEIDARREPEVSRHRQRICALVPDVGSVWSIFTVVTGHPVELVSVSGCSIGRVEENRVEDYAVRAVELRLDRALEVGECADLEFRLVRPPHPTVRGELWPGWMRMVEEPGCRQLDMRIRFAGQQRPNEAWQGTWRIAANGVPEPAVKEPVRPAGGGWFALSRTNPRPGAYGFHWRWPGDREAATPIGIDPEEPR